MLFVRNKAGACSPVARGYIWTKLFVILIALRSHSDYLGTGRAQFGHVLIQTGEDAPTAWHYAGAIAVIIAHADAS